MIVLDVIRKIRQRLRAVAEAKPAQWHSGTVMLRFLALMFLLTLLVRGTAASTIPVVTVTAPYQGVVTQSFTVSGQMSPGAGTPLTVPEGLLIEQVLVQSGDSVTKGQALALLSLDDIRTEIDQVQASIQQHQVQANQLMEGETADPFAWQQAQQQLDRAYGRREIEQFSKDSTAPTKGKTTSYNQLTTVSAQDVIRVVMAYAFDRARLKYGYKLLRGADFDKKGAVDDNLRVQRFNTLKEKLPDVLNVHSWHEFIKAIMNAGYLSGDLILSGNAIFYTYALYLIAKHRFNASYNENMHLTSLWFFYASLISLYTGSFESTVENHLNTIKSLKTLDEYKEFILSRVNERLTNDYFDITLVGSEGLAVSGRGNNAWNAYVASLNIMNAKILFSKSNLLVSKLFEPGTDGNRKSLEKHHLFPKAYLKSQGYSDAKINQMANYAFIDWKDNMDILDDAPSVYYPIVCAGLSDEQIRAMEDENALPRGWENMPYEDFLIVRRKLMAAKIKAAFEILKRNAE